MFRPPVNRPTNLMRLSSATVPPARLCDAVPRAGRRRGAALRQQLDGRAPHRLRLQEPQDHQPPDLARRTPRRLTQRVQGARGHTAEPQPGRQPAQVRAYTQLPLIRDSVCPKMLPHFMGILEF